MMLPIKMIEIFNSIYISLRSKMKIETFNIDENKVPLIDFYMHIATSVQLSIRLEDTNYKEIKKLRQYLIGKILKKKLCLFSN